MKTLLFALAALTLTALPAFAQSRQRILDNFGTGGGVKVYRPDFVPVGAKSSSSAIPASTLSRGKQKLLQRTAQVKARNLPVVSRMSVTEGLADHDMVRPSTTRMQMGSSTQLRGFTTGDARIDSYIVDSSRRYGIDPLLIYSQMHQESSFKPRATSNKGASGLMQLMPGTARRMGVENIYDPKQNIDGGVKYMRLLLDMFNGDVRLALAGYNAGEGAVMKYGNQIPPFTETQEYVRRITARYSEVSDPSVARTLKRVSSTEAAKLGQKDARPLTAYEPNAVAIRLADGRMRLVNQ